MKRRRRKFWSMRHQNEHFSIEFRRLCIAHGHGIMPHRRAWLLLPCRRAQSPRQAPTASLTLRRPPPFPSQRAPRARLTALRSPTRAHGRQVARNGVKLTRLPPACSPVATRRRTIFGDDLFRPYSQKTSTATTRGAAVKIWRWEVKKGNFSRAFGRR